MIVVSMIALVLTSQFLVDAAASYRPEGRVEVFYGNDLSSLEAFDLASETLEEYQGYYYLDYLPVTDPWSRHLLERYGVRGDSVSFAVAVNGTCSALMEGDTVSFIGLPARMRGSSSPVGEWTLAQLEMTLIDAELLLTDTALTPCPATALADSILEDAVSYLGTPYVWGGTDSRGFDCSGLAYRVFNDNGVPLPRTVGAIEDMGVPVDRDDLRPGDVLIFDSPRHTGIYMGSGEFIHCSSWQDRGVVITPLSQSNYARRYSSAVRILGTGPDY